MISQSERGLCYDNTMAKLAAKKALTLEAAREIAAAAQAEARSNGWNVVIAVVDDGGHLIYLERMDGTQVASVIVAQEKAACAIRFKRPTKALEDVVAGGRTVIMKLAGAVPVEGGLPIVVDGEFLGAIGVSGVTSAQDGQVAAAGLAALARIS
jgi:glc operon protein GlcG